MSLDFSSVDSKPVPSQQERPTRSAATEHLAPNPALWMGVYIGALLNIVMIGSLVAANRFPALDRYALERNAASYGLFVILVLVPVVRFINRPVQMFTAGIVGWTLFAAGYNLAGMYFHNLFQVLRTPLEVLIEGALLYGVTAVLAWVAMMALHAKRHSITPRRRPYPVVPYRR